MPTSYYYTSVYGVSLAIQPNLPDDHFRADYAQLLQDFGIITARSQPTMLNTDYPVEQPRRLSGEKLEAAKQHIDNLLQCGVIRP